MPEFLKVLIINLVSDIDNMLILGTILRKYAHLKISLPAIIVLTIARVIYITIINKIIAVPMLHLLIGVILLFLALKLVTKSETEEHLIRPSNHSILLKVKVIFMIIATDFLICLDSVVIISGLSQHTKAILLGIFCSLFISILFLPLIVRLATTFFWINIIAGAVIAQNAVVGILSDPMLIDWFQLFQIPLGKIINTAANATIIIFIVIGVLSYIKSQRIIIHK